MEVKHGEAERLYIKLKAQGIEPKKRINPDTLKVFVNGDKTIINGEQKFFCQYRTKRAYELDGEYYYHEDWGNADQFLRYKVSRSVARFKARSKDERIPFNLDSDYLYEIFPKDYICPVLGIKMKWGDAFKKYAGDSSPSLDKIIPNKGYVKGNVIWISWRANDIKKNATVDELEQVLSFYKNL